MPYRWLLFDADETLFDFSAAESGALQAVFSHMGLSFTDENQTIYRQINRGVWEAFEQGLLPSSVLSVTRFERFAAAMGTEHDASEISLLFTTELGKGTQLLAGAETLLQSLHQQIGLSLITNGLKAVQRSRLARSTISHYFSSVTISEEEGVAKPDAGLFDIAFERMGNPQKRDVLMIGDSLSSDMRGGINYGVDTCWFNPAGKAKPAGLPITYEISALEQLPAIALPASYNQ